MARYEITVEEIERYTLILEADSEADACEKAEEILETEESAKPRYHNESDGRSRAVVLV